MSRSVSVGPAVFGVASPRKGTQRYRSERPVVMWLGWQADGWHVLPRCMTCRRCRCGLRGVVKALRASRSQASMLSAEPFDDGHRSTATRAHPRRRSGPAGNTSGGPWSGRLRQQLTAERNELGTASGGEYAEVTDASESARQDMQQEAPEKLIATECHLPLLVGVCVVLPPKRDLIAFEGQQPVVGDGDTMGVAREVMQHVFWSAKRTLRIDHPVVAEQLPEEFREDGWSCKAGK